MSRPPRSLLVDFAMPVANGAEVAAEAVRLRPHLPILLTTGYADIGMLWRSRAATIGAGVADLDLGVCNTATHRLTSTKLIRNAVASRTVFTPLPGPRWQVERQGIILVQEAAP